MAAAFHLAKAGLRVLRIEAETVHRDAVGESLDWSAPELLAAFPQHVGRLALLSPALFPELKPFFLLDALRKPILGELLAPLIGPIFWKIAMRRALGSSERGNQIVDSFHKPFSSFAGPWQFMRVLRWGKPAAVLAEVPGFLPSLLMPALVFHGAHDPAIPKAFARRASEPVPDASMVTLESSHFIPLNQPTQSHPGSPASSAIIRPFMVRPHVPERYSSQPEQTHPCRMTRTIVASAQQSFVARFHAQPSQ
jgi:pimeloyl-ACP methyl ester carboxylesterase